MAWLLAETARQPVLAVWEDLHWADPSTLELLDLMLDHVPTARLLLVLTSRPEFRPPWAPRSYVTQLTLTRLPRHQSEEMVVRVTGGKPVPAEVLAQIVAKTDGIPLFVEELVKTILEAGLVQEDAGRYVLTGPLPPLAIPATLQDALMARLDRLAVVKEVAQLGAVLGREFAYELLRAVAPLDEATLQQALARLVEAELLYQRGVPPQATYVFKHALIQDAAYQSLLKSTRQQYHQRIAQVLEPVSRDRRDAARTAGPSLYRGGPQRAGHSLLAAGWPAPLQRSANLEAISHLTRAGGAQDPAGHPSAPSRSWTCRSPSALALHGHQGPCGPRSGAAYARARSCAAGGGPPQLFRVLVGGLWRFIGWGRYQTALELGEQLSAWPSAPGPYLPVGGPSCPRGHLSCGIGELVAASHPLEQGLRSTTAAAPHPCLALQPRPGCVPLALQCVLDPVAAGLSGPGLARSQEALPWPRSSPIPLILTSPCTLLPWSSVARVQAAQAQAEAAMTSRPSTEFPHYQALGTILRGWALTEQGQGEEGLAQIHQGLAAYRGDGGTGTRPYYLALLAEAYGKGQTEEGLAALAEALAAAQTGERVWREAECIGSRGNCCWPRKAQARLEAEACFPPGA